MGTGKVNLAPGSPFYFSSSQAIMKCAVLLVHRITSTVFCLTMTQEQRGKRTTN